MTAEHSDTAAMCRIHARDDAREVSKAIEDMYCARRRLELLGGGESGYRAELVGYCERRVLELLALTHGSTNSP